MEDDNAEFIPGRELSRLYYEEVVQPILQHHFPDLTYSAGLLGPGSEVLGFDTPLSTDHDWAPTVILYLAPADLDARAGEIWAVMGQELPFTFRGYPTQLSEHPDDPGSTGMVRAAGRPIEHHQVRTANLARFVRAYTGIDLARGPTLLDWLLVPEQLLLTLAGGAVFQDGLGVLAQMQRALAYYPEELWRYLLAAQWQRIGEEEPFVGRAGHAGDDTGSAVIAARLVRDVMRLCFLLERRYAPYAKWFGFAFARLPCASRLSPTLAALLRAGDWQARERLFGRVYAVLAEMHNALGLTEPVATELSPFFGRPFAVMQGAAIAGQIAATIEDPAIRALPPGVGKVDQFVDNVDVLSYPARFRQLAPVYAT